MIAYCFYLFKGRGGGIHSRFKVFRCFSCAERTVREALRGGYGGGGVDVHARAAELERRRVLGRRVAAGRLCMPVRRVATGRLHVPVRHAAAEWLNARGEDGRGPSARDENEGSRRPTARGEDGRWPFARGENGRRSTVRDVDGR